MLDIIIIHQLLLFNLYLLHLLQHPYNPSYSDQIGKPTMLLKLFLKTVMEDILIKDLILDLISKPDGRLPHPQWTTTYH